MQSGEFLYQQNELAVVLVVFALFLIVAEFGFRRGRAVRNSLTDPLRAQLAVLQAAMMGLLGLLLAFSFAMAESRFETRQTLVVDEANAIGTASLRAQLLPEPWRGEVQKLLRNYVDERLAYYEAGTDRKKLDDANARAKEAQKELWAQAVAAAAAAPTPITALFIASLNNVIDLHEKRDAARRNHAPGIVLYLLFFVAIVSMGLAGFGCGLGNRRAAPIILATAVLIALVILVIMDLDRPRRGIIEVNQQSMINLRASLE